ncbi:MAG TPA: PAS domain-containing protein, partial [Phaeodactylibacter sp.]|nr:PAS domain-containing protein [Phaeodactylibacter sp.]
MSKSSDEADKLEKELARERATSHRLEQNNRFLQSFLESRSFYVIATDLQGRYTYCNQHYCNCHQEPAGKMIGSDALQHIVPEDRPLCLSTLKKCLRQPNTPFSVELRKPHSQSPPKSVRWEFTAVTDEEG